MTLPRTRRAAAGGPARVAAHTVGTHAVRLILGAVMGAVVGRTLGPDGRGAYGVLVTVATTAVSLGHLSIEESHVSMWPQVRDARGITANSVLFGLAIGGFCSVAGAAVVVLLGPGVVPLPSYGLLAVALAAVPFAMTEKLVARVMVLRARIDVNNVGGLLSIGLQCAGLVLLAATGRLTLWWVVVLWTACAAVPLVVILPAARPRARHGDLRLARRALRMGVRYHAGLVAVFLLLRVDILILNAMASTAAVGLYTVAVSFAELSRLAPDAVANIAMPAQLDRDETAAAATTAAATRIAALVAAVSTGLACAAAPFVIPAVYGKEFAGSLAPLLGLAPGLWFVGASRPVGAFLLRLDRPKTYSAVAVAALAVNLVLNLALIPPYGIVGSALASVIGYGTLATLQVVWFLRATGISPWRLAPRGSDARYLLTAARKAFLPQPD